jgi:hypothetical protein
MIGADSNAEVLRVNATPEVAWIGLPGVFEALEIPVELLDTGRKMMGNPDHRVRGRIAGRPLSEYLSCGTTMSGQIANQYDVRLSVVSPPLPGEEEEEGTGIRTRVEATARSRSGASGSAVTCSSTGRLEERVAELLNRSVGR